MGNENLKIAKNTVVTVQYTLSDAQGERIETGLAPIVYLHGGYDNTLPRIERALDGKGVGYEVLLDLTPDDAYGQYDPALVKVEPRHRLPSSLEIGMQLEGAPYGSGEGESVVLFSVTSIYDDNVVLDGNHPLAGMELHYALKVVNVRPATNDEKAHKHVHGEHGHSHD